ncbi:MAG: hypothetical protein GY866_06960 [Proteobacteria bacterium]|nr:hypothetical protein [Pseudomonadota bacterium]
MVENYIPSEDSNFSIGLHYDHSQKKKSTKDTVSSDTAHESFTQGYGGRFHWKIPSYFDIRYTYSNKEEKKDTTSEENLKEAETDRLKTRHNFRTTFLDESLFEFFVAYYNRYAATDYDLSYNSSPHLAEYERTDAIRPMLGKTLAYGFNVGYSNMSTYSWKYEVLYEGQTITSENIKFLLDSYMLERKPDDQEGFYFEGNWIVEKSRGIKDDRDGALDFSFNSMAIGYNSEGESGFRIEHSNEKYGIEASSPTDNSLFTKDNSLKEELYEIRIQPPSIFISLRKTLSFESSQTDNTPYYHSFERAKDKNEMILFFESDGYTGFDISLYNEKIVDTNEYNIKNEYTQPNVEEEEAESIGIELRFNIEF